MLRAGGALYALRLSQVHKSFGNHPALRGVDLTVARGTVHAFLGSNGSGKSTSVRVVLGLLTQDAGHAELLGAPPTIEARRRVGYLPEQRGIYLSMRIVEHLAFLGRLHGMCAVEATRAANTWLERLGLGSRKQSKGKELSKGLQQKVQIAAALMHEPELLVFDEPFNGLDPVAQLELESILQEAVRRGATVLLCTHLIEHAERLASHATLVCDGQTLIEDKIASIRREAMDGWFEVEFEGSDAWLQPLMARPIERKGTTARIQVDSGRVILEAALAAGVHLRRFEEVVPSLRDVMIERTR